MNLLAIETATECCSVALSCNGAIIERSELAPRRHAELVLPMIESVLAEAGLARRAIDVIAVGRGPGAFTGVRLAISVAQGLALGLDVPVLPVSSLAAMAQHAPDDGMPILAVIDARMGEIYAGVFTRGADGLVHALNNECVGHADLIALPQHSRWCVVGSGWATYAPLLELRLGAAPIFADGARFPQARAIAELALPHALAGDGVSAELALPVYLRDKVALTLDEQRSARAK